MKNLSILIPARNEEFLKETLDDLLKNIRHPDTEIVVVLDGAWSCKSLPVHQKITVVYLPEARGQRAAQNVAAKLARNSFLMKVDAHCAFDEGFDVKMLNDIKEDEIAVPLMRNLHVFDWVCKNGHRRYQGPSGPCQTCNEPTEKDIVWIPKTNPQSTSYCFDSDPHFQYHNSYKKVQQASESHIVETMSLQGSCFMCSKEKYWNWNICDEEWGSWGSQGIECAIKFHYNGGKVVCNTSTWYAHLFRTQGGDFSFPYPQPGNKVQDAKAKAREFIHSQPEKLSDLIKKFNPPGWEKPKKAVLYYTDSRIEDKDFAVKCRKQIIKGMKEKHITSVSLKPLDFGRNIVISAEPGIKTMFKQILRGLEEITDPIVFFCEHDVLYHPSHFDFIPPRKDRFYYNTNVWKWKYDSDKVVWTDNLQQTSGLVCYRELAIKWYKKKIQEGDTKHFEPSPRENYVSVSPNICIRHGGNLTKDKWKPEDFRDPKYAVGWKESTLSEIFGKAASEI